VDICEVVVVEKVELLHIEIPRQKTITMTIDKEALMERQRAD